MILYPQLTNETSNIRNDDVLSRDSVEVMVAHDSESYRAVLAWLNILVANNKESSKPRVIVDDIITKHCYPCMPKTVNPNSVQHTTTVLKLSKFLTTL